MQKRILQTFTYKDGSGKRRLRDYVKVTVGLLVLVLAVSVVGVYNRSRMLSNVMATPRALDAGSIPTPTETVLAPIPRIEECPSDPAEWILLENAFVLGSNLKGLSPQCAYDQLEQTAAWFYATYVLGHSRLDAAHLFGFSKIPISYRFGLGQITVLTDYKDEPQKVNLRFPSDNTGLSEWRIDSSGHPAVEFTFSGCFRTSSINGGQIVSWGDGYSIVCQYSSDFQTRHYVSDVNGKTLAISGTENVRRLMWFGYAGNGSWNFLGIAKDWEYDLSQIHNRNSSTINPSVMAQKYGVNSLPLPKNWNAFTGQGFVDAFLEELDISE
jgi:hypothetical protein